MKRHPLTVLRASIDHKQAAYARLVAKAHADLNLGTLAARPEKISLWESGRVVPDLGAQFAIAHFHHVPRDKVLALCRPLWLYHAGGDAPLLMRPWTADETVAALSEADQPGADGSPRPSLAVIGRGITILNGDWHGATVDSAPIPPQPGHPVDACITAAIAARVDNFEKLRGAVGPKVLYPAAHGELQLITGLLRTAGYNRQTRSRLLLLAAHTAVTCGILMDAVGNSRRAERYMLASIRAATTASAPQFARGVLHDGHSAVDKHDVPARRVVTHHSFQFRRARVCGPWPELWNSSLSAAPVR
ncbi:hypothetical protein ACVB8X_36705 [Streptomyces sp. NRAIS4]